MRGAKLERKARSRNDEHWLPEVPVKAENQNLQAVISNCFLPQRSPYYFASEASASSAEIKASPGRCFGPSHVHWSLTGRKKTKLFKRLFVSCRSDLLTVSYFASAPSASCLRKLMRVFQSRRTMFWTRPMSIVADGADPALVSRGKSEEWRRTLKRLSIHGRKQIDEQRPVEKALPLVRRQRVSDS